MKKYLLILFLPVSLIAQTITGPGPYYTGVQITSVGGGSTNSSSSSTNFQGVLAISNGGTGSSTGNASALNNYTTNVFDVSKYGAVGDGSTDSTLAISNAWAAWIADTNAADLFFPPGQYLTKVWQPFVPGTSSDGTFFQFSRFDNNFQVSHHRIKGAGSASTLWVSYVTNCNFISITNAGIQISGMAFERGGGLGTGTNTGIAQFGGNGNGEAAYDDITMKGWTTGIYVNSFCNRIVGHVNDCGNGIVIGGQCDGLVVDVYGWSVTNAIVVALNGAGIKVRSGGTFINYGLMVGPGCSVELMGEVESVSNAFATLGLPGYMLSNNVIGVGQPYINIHDFHFQSSSTNPLIKLYTNGILVAGGNITYQGSGNSPAILSANSSGDTAKMQLSAGLNPFIGLSSGTTMGFNGDPLRSGYGIFINDGLGFYNTTTSTNNQLNIDTSGNISTLGALAVSSLSTFTNGALFTKPSFGSISLGVRDGVNPSMIANGSAQMQINFGSGGGVINDLANTVNGLVVNGALTQWTLPIQTLLGGTNSILTASLGATIFQSATLTVSNNPISVNTKFTNSFNTGTLSFNYTLTDSSVTGSPGLIFSNITAGYGFTLSNNFILTGAQQLAFTSPHLSKNDIVVVTNLSSGSATAAINSSVITYP